uniref:Uncharacterized protein n=1 Tax=Solanum lycopersicum TaxID=4081 RepID=A0A3Q7H555_SOLLC
MTNESICLLKISSTVVLGLISVMSIIILHEALVVCAVVVATHYGKPTRLFQCLVWLSWVCFCVCVYCFQIISELRLSLVRVGTSCLFGFDLNFWRSYLILVANFYVHLRLK